MYLHPYRDIKDTTVGTLSQRITNQVHGLKGLNSKLLDIRSYLERVAAGKLPINHQIIYQLQDVFNLLPDVNLLVSWLCLYLFCVCRSHCTKISVELQWSKFHLILSDIWINIFHFKVIIVWIELDFYSRSYKLNFLLKGRVQLKLWKYWNEWFFIHFQLLFCLLQF